jgi:hypothetical protein
LVVVQDAIPAIQAVKYSHARAAILLAILVVTQLVKLVVTQAVLSPGIVVKWAVVLAGPVVVVCITNLLIGVLAGDQMQFQTHCLWVVPLGHTIR